MPQTASRHPRASTLTASGLHKSSQGHGFISDLASTRIPLRTGEGKSRQVRLAPDTPTAMDGVAQVAEWQTHGCSSCPSQKKVRFLTAPISSIRLMARASWETLWPDPAMDLSVICS